MSLDSKQLKEILLAGNYLSLSGAASLETYEQQGKEDLAGFLIEQGILTKDIIGQAIAEHYGVPYADLNSNMPTKELVLRLPEAFAKKYDAAVFTLDNGAAVVATAKPQQKALKGAAKTAINKTKQKDQKAVKSVAIHYSLPEDIQDAHRHYRKPLQDRLDALARKAHGAAPDVFEEIVLDALTLQSSDIHFDPREKNVVVRFRIDGLLRDVATVSKELYTNVLNHIKVRSGLRTDLHAATQDGALRYETKHQRVDMRVSVAPLIDGQKVVMRLLAQYVRGMALADLGLSESHQQQLERAAAKPFGMILVVGPTGSGKTTSLYGLIKKLNKPDINIATIEDPVEYKIAGVNHMQVNKETELTFATGLRSIVRQDPDVILVGEIRDNQTADIATNAALTGHLMLSTFHANDAATAIPRLMDMNIEPFILSSTLELIIAQRLVRKICERCRESKQIPKRELSKKYPSIAKSIKATKMTYYQGKGCSSCSGTGYAGRTALFEFISVDQTLSEMIMRNPTAGQIRQHADKAGSPTLFTDGLLKIQQGITTMEEVIRVASV